MIITRDAASRLRHAPWLSGQSMWDAETGIQPLTVDMISVKEGNAQDYAAKLLNRPRHSLVFIRERRFSLARKPVMYATSYIPAEYARGTRITEVDPGPGGIYARLAEAGLGPVRFTEDLSVRPAHSGESDILELANDLSPVAEITRTAYDVFHRIVEVCIMTADVSSYVFRTEIAVTAREEITGAQARP